MAAKFVHLHVHSHYSLLKALPKIPDLVARAKEEGCEAFALTDIDNLYGAIEFYKECKSQGIKPIIGLDASVESRSRQILLAENLEGYRNLLKLVTLSHMHDATGRPLTRSEHQRALRGHYCYRSRYDRRAAYRDLSSQSRRPARVGNYARYRASWAG